MNPSVKAIAAMSENRVIGKNGSLPWHLPEDFRWFKEKTMGGILVMGRKTYESISRALPGREIYVLSRRSTPLAGVKRLSTPEAINELKTDKTIWIAGGAQIYEQALPFCSELYLTRVHKEVERGDAFFPTFEDRFSPDSIVLKNDSFTIEHWTLDL